MRPAHALAVAVAAAAGGVVLASPARAKAIEQAVAALQSDPVYVEPSVAATLDPNDEEELRERIRASGDRIYVAVLGPDALAEVGGDPEAVLGELASELDGNATTVVVVVGDQLRQVRATSGPLGAQRAAQLVAESAREHGSEGVGPVLLDFVDRAGAELEDASPAEDESSGGLAWALLAGAIGAAIGIAGTLLGVAALRPRRRAEPTPAGAETQPAPGPVVDDAAARERKTLVTTVVDLLTHDMIRGDSVRDQLRDALAEAGVTEVRSDGEPFDPERHRAVGWQATEDPALENRVAATETPGYSDHGQPLELPEVEVYRVNRE